MVNNFESKIEHIKNDVNTLLVDDTSGHGVDHVTRVLKLALDFAEKENADTNIVQLAVLLHDVDDYKLFGQKHADELINANEILNKHAFDDVTKIAVLGIIRSMGYSKYLDGVRPDSIEGRVISDADMCDAIGAIGVLRTHAYALSIGNDFFDKTIHPRSTAVSASEYKAPTKEHSAQHFFDKLLKVPSIMMTEAGKAEAQKRQVIMTLFLRHLFEEQDSEEWLDYLDQFEKTAQ